MTEENDQYPGINGYYKAVIDKYRVNGERPQVAAIQLKEESGEGGYLLIAIGNPDLQYMPMHFRGAIRALSRHLTQRELFRAKALAVEPRPIKMDDTISKAIEAKENIKMLKFKGQDGKVKAVLSDTASEPEGFEFKDQPIAADELPLPDDVQSLEELEGEENAK